MHRPRTTSLDVPQIVARLGMQPHPEGGFFVETYRASLELALPEHRGSRAASTAIFFLITADSFSALHRVASDEVFHFYLGDPVEMLHLDEKGGATNLRLGTDLAAGERPQVVVPAGIWQGARVADGGRFALLGATVAPGFDFADFEMGQREELLRRHPEHADAIERFTRPST